MASSPDHMMRLTVAPPFPEIPPIAIGAAKSGITDTSGAGSRFPKFVVRSRTLMKELRTASGVGIDRRGAGSSKPPIGDAARQVRIDKEVSSRLSWRRIDLLQ
jgi:hypothetical protein